jgi:hypothetical protein
MEVERTVLYHRDNRTGDHMLTHAGESRRFGTRAVAISAARELLLGRPDEEPEAPSAA